MVDSFEGSKGLEVNAYFGAKPLLAVLILT